MIIKNYNLKITLTGVFLLLLVQNRIFAQQFEPGYILTTEKDTLPGFVLEQIDNELVHEMKFRKDPQSEIQTFTPSEISGFGFGYGRDFRSFRFSSDETVKDNVVFAKEVETGKIDVLVWRRNKNRKPDIFLVNRESRDIVHLTRPKKEFMVTEEGKHFSKEDRNYLRLMGDIKGEGFAQREIRYNEKKIRRDIYAYNQEFGDDFYVFSHTEKRKKEYIFVGGTAVDHLFNERPRLRVAVIQSRTFVERTNTLSYISGIFYTYREKKEMKPHASRAWDGLSDYKRQWVSLIPVGVMLQTRPGKIRPYVYGGLGLAVAKLEYHIVENASIVGRETSYTYGPTLATGAGARFRMGSTYIVAEIAPTIEGIFFNLGYSF